MTTYLRGDRVQWVENHRLRYGRFVQHLPANADAPQPLGLVQPAGTEGIAAMQWVPLAALDEPNYLCDHCGWACEGLNTYLGHKCAPGAKGLRRYQRAAGVL